MRTLLLVALIGLFSWSLPESASGQGADTHPRVDVSVFAGLGSGPTRSAASGVGSEVPLHDLVGLTIELSQWSSGVGAVCPQIVPDYYRCDVGGWAVLGGFTVRTPRLGRIEPFGELLGGGFFRSQGDADYRSPALGLGLGADLRLLPGFSVRAGARYTRPFDDAYADFMGEELSYAIMTLGIRYSFTW